MRSDRTLDCFGLLCPMPIVKTAKVMKLMKIGEVLEVQATDVGIKTDMPAWCKATEQEYLGMEEENGEFRSYVKKVKE